jgi:CheY-like chemotaxis protein
VVQPKNILLAEDNYPNQRVTKYLLEKLGLEVHCVSSGRDAVTVASRNQFDLILMDVRMPVIDGLRATAEIREIEIQQERGRRTPIIALTASAMPGDRERCIDAGMDDYLSLPFTQNDLVNKIKTWLAPGDWEIEAGSGIIGTSIETVPGEAMQGEAMQGEVSGGA